MADADDERKALREADPTQVEPIVIVTGFVASTIAGAPTTLKRSGSDYSATIFARLMGASRITMSACSVRAVATPRLIS